MQRLLAWCKHTVTAVAVDDFTTSWTDGTLRRIWEGSTVCGWYPCGVSLLQRRADSSTHGFLAVNVAGRALYALVDALCPGKLPAEPPADATSRVVAAMTVRRGVWGYRPVTDRVFGCAVPDWPRHRLTCSDVEHVNRCGGCRRRVMCSTSSRLCRLRCSWLAPAATASSRTCPSSLPAQCCCTIETPLLRCVHAVRSFACLHMLEWC